MARVCDICKKSSTELRKFVHSEEILKVVTIELCDSCYKKARGLK